MRLAAVALSLSLGGGLAAQPVGLPDLGDPASIELSQGLERRLGEAIMVNGRRDPAWISDPDLTVYLQGLADVLTSHAPEGQARVDIFALREPRINAFAMPGGFIGVHTGLILAARSESELAGVIAHEIAHVTQRHIARGIVQQKQDSLIALGAMAAALLAARAGGAGQLPEAVAIMGQAAAINSTLRFSRDAEREADRVGFLMLEGAGFDPAGMAGFFGRLLSVSRLNEGSGRSYASTHPMSIERMSDMQNRLQQWQGKPRPDSADFHHAQALARYLQAGDGARELDEGLRFFVAQAEEAVTPSLRQAAAVGAARVLLAQRRFDEAGQWLQRAAREAAVHPALDRVTVDLYRARGNLPAALTMVRQARERWPRHQSLVRLEIEILLQMQKVMVAREAADAALAIWPDEPELWRLKAAAEAARGSAVDERRAMSEHYALLGAWPSAVEQLMQARSLSTDFFEQSQLDARSREFQLRLRDERELLRRFEQR
jgi:predicted Zn-dependent protease